MPETETEPPRIVSTGPETTAELMRRTGLSDAILTDLVHGFYARVRRDALLAPVFAERISDWGPHLQRMVAFWSSVALMTGRYRGQPVPKHAALPIDWEHFQRWLELFRATARDICPPEGAAHVIERAEHIARSLFAAGEVARHQSDATPVPDKAPKSD